MLIMPLEQAIAPSDFRKLNREGHRKWTGGLGSPLQAERPSPIADLVTHVRSRRHADIFEPQLLSNR